MTAPEKPSLQQHLSGRLGGTVITASKPLLGALCVLALGLAACSESPPPSSSHSVSEERATSSELPAVAASFREFLDENYAVDMARTPYTASNRGIRAKDDQWNSVAESHQEETRAINEARLIQLKQFDREALDARDRLFWDLYHSTLTRLIASDEFRHHKFIIHQYRAAHTQAANNLINVHRVNNITDARNYIGRLNNIAVWFDQIIEQMDIRADKGLLLARWQYPPTIQASWNIISGAPFSEAEDSVLWADFKGKVTALNIPEKERADLLNKARRALLDSVEPAYKRLIAALEAQAQIADDRDGVWKFPRGDEFYAERLRWFTTTNLSAQDIHDIGLREVSRIHSEIQAVMKEVNFEGSLAEFFVFMREDPQFYYPDTDPGREAYLADAKALIDNMRARLPEAFGLLPKAPLVLKRVEPFRERSAGRAFYQRPPADGSRPGIYYSNLYNMRDMPRYQLEALAYHEGVPGHHMQRAIAVELEKVPDFQKNASFTAFSEGWGLYSELLARDMGLYKDPYSNFGRLDMELWRACRLVVDTGIHSMRWTREQAIAYLMENTPASVGTVTKAIERYIAKPGQATAYMIGKLKIVELRERARQALGDAFDLRLFHDVVLRDGTVPLTILEQKVDTMIAEQLKSSSLLP
jgi:uncharacterized protein (DUF885 family)